MEKKKILFISTYYLRRNSSGSIRPRKLVKYLSAADKYDISILTADQSEKNTLTNSSIDYAILDNERYFSRYTLVPRPYSMEIVKKIWRVLHPAKQAKLTKPAKLTNTENHSKDAVSRSANKTNGASQDDYPNSAAAKLVKYTLSLHDDMVFYRRAKRIIRKEKLWETDIIFSTYPTVACHYIARYIKKKNPAARWVADFRDSVYYDYEVPGLFKAYAKNFVKKKCKTADAINMISQGIADNTSMPDVPVHVISNGFDPDDAPEFEANRNGKLTITYTGALESFGRDMTVLFKAIQELADDGLVDLEKIRVEYAGASVSAFFKQSSAFNLNKILHSYGFVERSKALEIQRKSDILLVLSLNTEGTTGIYSGKFFEYMMMKKPILSIITGNLPNSINKEIIEKCSLGFCYEEACDEQDYELLKNYLHKQYRHFLDDGNVSFEPDEEEINYYNYANITQRLEKLFS